MDLTMYVYGNGDFIMNVLASVSFFMKNAMSFFKLATILSIMVFMVESLGILPSRGYDWMKFMRVFFVLSVFVLTPYPGKVTVHDVITNQDRVFNLQNSKLPWGLVAPVAIISTLSYRLIDKYEQNMQIGSSTNLNYTYSGLNFGANFITSLDRANSYDANFNYNLDQYMQNCGFPLLNKAGALSQLRGSADIFNTLSQFTSSSRFVQQVDFNEGKTNIVMSCQTAITNLTTYYNANQNKILQANFKMMGGSQYDRFIGSADATAKDLMGISDGASKALKQAIGMNMIMASLKNGAHATGNGDLALAAYDAEAFQEYKKSSELSGSAAARTVPILVGTAYALIFMLYPIMIFLALTMGSFKAIAIFFRVTITINLIPLIYDIINFMTNWYLQQKLGTMLTSQSYSYDTSASMYDFADNMIISTNYLATAAPMLAWFIISGAENSVSSLFGTFTGKAETKADKIGTDTARGNNSIGNTSIDTHSSNTISGNKFDEQFSSNSGAGIMKDTSAFGTNTNFGGRDYGQQFKDQTNTSVNMTSAATHSLENRLSQSKDQSTQLSKQWGNTANTAYNLANGVNQSQGFTDTIGTSDRSSLNQMNSLSTKLGLELPYVGGMNSLQQAQYSKDLSKYEDLKHDLSQSTNQTISNAYSKTDSLSSSTSNLVSDITSTSKALSDIKSNSAGVNSDFTSDWNNHLRSQGMTTEQIQSMPTSEQNASANAYVNTYLKDKYGLKDNLVSPSAVHNNAAQPSSTNNINPSGLTPPTNGTTISTKLNSASANFNNNVNDYTNNPGKVLGNQALNQATTTGKIAQNATDQVINVLGNANHPENLFPTNGGAKTEKKYPVDPTKNQIPD